MDNHTQPCSSQELDRPFAHIRQVGMAGGDNDLMVLVISSTNEDQARVWYSLYITLLQFSTGEHHPLAHRPRIDVGEYEMGQHVFLEVAGDNIALLIDTYGISQLSIFDWKTGLKKLQHHTLETAYCRLAFVSPEILLVPNAIKGQYEVWRIPWKQMAFHIRYCRGRPNPHNMLRTSPKPFHTSPDETVIITIVNIAISPNQFGTRLALFIRRRYLLEAITNLTQSGVPPPFDVRHHFNDVEVNYDDSGTRTPYSFTSPPPPRALRLPLAMERGIA
ncbi:hypothetical protein F5887DRAFT_1204793 [Amanita rubescens]|nr:hypothetical protein F5887DRAFT_1204793 [Amanita rubescens]